MVALLLFPMLLQLLSPTCAQTQKNITLGSTLAPQSPASSWLSPSGDFAFGFRPVEGNTSFYLIAVWFNKISDKTVVWYAKNTDQDPSIVEVPSDSFLQLTNDGALSLKDRSGQEGWNPQVTSVAYASMRDTGNFVLLGADGTTKWQTFDMPSDTILPTQVIPCNKTRNKSLRARLDIDDYSSGRFLLDVQTDGNLALYLVAVPSGSKYQQYWSTDTTGNGSELVFSETGKVYFALTDGTQINISSGAGIGSMADYFHRATLDPDGVFRQYVYPKKANAGILGGETWTAVSMQPQNICHAIVSDVGSGVCGFNSYCTFDGTRNQIASCQCPPWYKFFDEQKKYKGCKQDFQPHSCDLDEATALAQFELRPIYGVDWPLSDYEKYEPIGQDDCGRLCVIDCFCAMAVYNQSTSTCWKKKLPLSNGNMADYVQRTVLLKVPSSNSSQSMISTSSNKWKRNRKHWVLGSSLILGTSILVNFALISIFLFGTYCRIATKKNIPLSQASSKSQLPLKTFTYKELEKATAGFHEILGAGASGVVYKGQLEDELKTNIAVKKIDKLQPETEKEFMVEVETIGQTFHKNLVRLLGFCNEGAERLLVYEFMTNGPLNRLLFDNSRPHWNTRVHIALGVARGLLYLHDECSKQIIHCDIKPQNILLDDNLVAKISDFGLAKLLLTNQTRTNTGIRGTRGYVAPEWFKNIGISTKVDVYSFGVILLELVCCRRNVELEVVDEEQTIVTYWANDCYRSGRIDLLVEGDDEAIYNIKKVERFVTVALWCLQEDPSMRPNMLKVTQMLDGAVAIPSPPDPCSFISSLP